MGHRLNEDVSHGGRLDGPGDDLTTGCVSGELTERVTAGSAPDDMDDVDFPDRQNLDSRYLSARLSRMQRVNSGLPSGAPCPVRWQ